MAIPFSEAQEWEIMFCQYLIRAELARYGLRPELLPASSIYLLGEKEFSALKIGSEGVCGAYYHKSDFIVMLAGGWDGFRSFMSLLLHEMVHSTARTVRTKYHEGDSCSIRNGHAWLSGGVYRGHGLNEAVTERITRELLGVMRPSQHSMLNEDGQFPADMHSYYYYIETLGVVIRGMGKLMGCNPDLVWKSFKVAHFTGTKGHLKELNSLYGPQAQEVLETMGSLSGSSDPRDNIRLSGLIAHYFRIDISGARRDALCKEILSGVPMKSQER